MYYVKSEKKEKKKRKDEGPASLGLNLQYRSAAAVPLRWRLYYVKKAFRKCWHAAATVGPEGS